MGSWEWPEIMVNLPPHLLQDQHIPGPGKVLQFFWWKTLPGHKVQLFYAHPFPLGIIAMDKNTSFTCTLCSEWHILSKFCSRKSVVCYSCWSKQGILICGCSWLRIFPSCRDPSHSREADFFRDFKFGVLEHRDKTSSPFPSQNKSTPSSLPCYLFVSTSSCSNLAGKGKIKISRGSCSSWFAGGTLSELHFERNQLNRLRSHSHSLFQPGPIPFPPANNTSKFLISAWQKSKQKIPAQLIDLPLVAEGEKFMLRQNLALFSTKIQHYCA